MKRLLLLLCGLISVVMSVHAADGDEFTYTYNGQTLNYRILSESEGTCAVTGYNSEVVGALELPDCAYYRGIEYTLVTIGENAFSQCAGLTSVVIGNSVNYIRNRAFFNCNKLTSVVIQNSVKTIGNEAFGYCYGLTSVFIGNSVNNIGSKAFIACLRLIKSAYPDYLPNPFSYGIAMAYPAQESIIENGVVFDRTKTTLYFAPISLSGEYTVPSTVKTIGESAFYSCTDLTSVVIGNSVESIGIGAFANCTGLTSVVIGNSVNSIEKDAFKDCSGLIKTAYPANLPNPFSSGITMAYPAQESIIENGVVFDRTKTTLYFAPISLSGEYTVPSTVKTIGEYAFYDCTGLTSVVIGNSVESIGIGAFASCSGLTSVVIPNLVKTINDFVFNNCTSLSSVIIGNSVNNIGKGAFGGCSGLTSVEIPNSVKTICESAFYNCTSLTSVVIGNSVTSIGYSAFADCSGLTSIEIPNSVQTINDKVFIGCNSLTSVIIGDSVSSIGKYAFAGCSGLSSIEIPNSVQTIHEGAFNLCTSLTSVVIGNSVNSIGYGSFANCSELTSVVIPNSVQTIGGLAFYNCTGLTSVVIGNSVKSIENDAFEDCLGLIKSAYPDNLPNPFSSGIAFAYPAQKTTIENGVIFDQTKTTLCFAPISLSGEYIVPSTVKSIADNAFLFCKDITYIRMPATLSSIGKNAFKDCNLYDFTIPNAVKSFDMGILSGNPLKSLTVGSGVTNISGATTFFGSGIEKIFWLGNNPPTGCYSFNTVVNFVSNDQYHFENQIVYRQLSSMFDIEGIVYVPVSPKERTCNVVDYFYAPSNAVFSVPATVTKQGIQLKVIDIGAYAFYHHDYLTDISLDNNGVIDDYAFYNCTKLQSVTFGNNIPEIKNHTFENCEVLKKVENSPALTSIGEWAFSGCVGMEYFSVGNKITSFGEEAFSDCSRLKEFYSYATTPPVCGNQALDDIRKWDYCTLYVPVGSEDLYASAPQWEDFFYINGIAGVETILVDDNENIEIYDLKGIKQTTRQEDLPTGIYIIRQGAKVKKIAVK